MVKLVLGQQLTVLERFFPNLARTIELLRETIKSF
jgi:hypothetical protein